MFIAQQILSLQFLKKRYPINLSWTILSKFPGIQTSGPTL